MEKKKESLESYTGVVSPFRETLLKNFLSSLAKSGVNGDTKIPENVLRIPKSKHPYEQYQDIQEEVSRLCMPLFKCVDVKMKYDAINFHIHAYKYGKPLIGEELLDLILERLQRCQLDNWKQAGVHIRVRPDNRTISFFWTSFGRFGSDINKFGKVRFHAYEKDMKIEDHPIQKMLINYMNFDSYMIVTDNGKDK